MLNRHHRGMGEHGGDEERGRDGSRALPKHWL
jgi:hypothetical protein